FCSSVATWRSSGPIIVRPKPTSGGRRRRRAISWASTLASAADRPPPPYSRGQVGAVQPRSAITASQRWTSSGYVVLRPPQHTSSGERGGVAIEGGALAASQRRTSSRKASRSAIGLV